MIMGGFKTVSLPPYLRTAIVDDLLIKIYKNGDYLELDLASETNSSIKNLISIITQDARIKIIDYQEALLLLKVGINYDIVNKKEIALLLLRS